MKTNKSLLAVAAAVVCCVIAVWFSTSIQGSQNTYELRPHVAIPEHKTEIVRVVDAYERLMERYLDLTERNSAMVEADIRAIAIRLDSIDAKLVELSTGIAGIEKALGISRPATPTTIQGKSRPATSEHEALSEVIR